MGLALYAQFFFTSGLVLSTVGGVTLAYLAIDSPKAIRRQLRPTINELGANPEQVRAAARGQRWATFGFATLASGLLFQLLSHFYELVAVQKEPRMLLAVGMIVLPTLALVYWGCSDIEARVLTEFEAVSDTE